MDGSVLGYSMAAGSSGGQKRKGETFMGVGGISYMISLPSIRQAWEQVEQ